MISKIPQSKAIDTFPSFSDIAAQAGLILYEQDIIADGKWHRVRVDSDRKGQKSGSYVVSAEGNGFAQNFKEPHRSLSWRDANANSNFDINVWREANKSRRKAEFDEKLKAADKARRIITALPFANSDHDYLRRKKVGAHGLHLNVDHLIVPLCDTHGKIWSCQSISPAGDKINMKGGKKNGCFHLIDNHCDECVNYDERLSAPAIIIAEGYSTSASIYEATGIAVAVAVDAGNLLNVAIAMRQVNKDALIIVCGDDDRFQRSSLSLNKTTGKYHGIEVSNTGRISASKAAEFVGGIAVFPEFHAGDWSGTDFNDSALSGIDIAQTIFDAAPDVERLSRQQRLRRSCRFMG